MTKLQLVATCMFGLEKQLGEELDALGIHRTETMDGRVYFEGDGQSVARANLWLRCAERVMIVLGRFPAQTYDDLFEGTKALPWEDWIGRDDVFPVKGHAIKSRLQSVPDCQKIIKKAVADRLADRYGIRWLPETGILYQIDFFLFKDEAALMIDTTGVSLHKRGYRPESGIAPLRETLAAAVAYATRPREDTLIWDPMCGSGTIAIESAMILEHRAPGLLRTFAGEAFPQIPEAVWHRERNAAESETKTGKQYEIWASDLDRSVLQIAGENAKRAGIEKNIRFFEADARAIRKPDRRGTLVCNPPYGERMMSPKDAEELYRALGSCFAAFTPWQIYILTSHPSFERLYGRKSDKIRRMYNGMIPCFLYQFFKPR